MAIVAPASKTVRNKNIILILLFAAFTAWFMYDAYIAWPARDDAIVQKLLTQIRENRLQTPVGAPTAEQLRPALENWPGWNKADPKQRELLGNIAKLFDDSWKGTLDIALQRYLAWGLVVGTLVTIWWYFHCQRRRAIADDQGLSPAPGVLIPWPAITKVDNTRWKKSRIVDLEYTDPAGQTRKAVLDEYLLDDLPPVLNEMATRADKAQFIAPEDEANPTPPSSSQPSA